ETGLPFLSRFFAPVFSSGDCLSNHHWFALLPGLYSESLLEIIIISRPAHVNISHRPAGHNILILLNCRLVLMQAYIDSIGI
ncbi:MAG: hypothetical protein J6Y48_18960, partial [Clostridia bacterium]|nr:hypothetical protein [Clostridia bacterium]